MNTFKYDGVCEACDGTGLYVGFAEQKGAAVVCNRCKGEGHYEVVIKYKDFSELKKRENIEKVFETNPGVCVGASTNGGISYEDWLKTKKFPRGSEMRDYVCPAWWYQTADYKKKPDWKECWACNIFASCKHFPTKNECWKRFDKENK